MGFKDAIKTCLDKYIDFSGRATRSEFWYFVLFLALVNLAGSMLFGAVAGNGTFRLALAVKFGLGSSESWFTNIYTALFVIPFLSGMTRRLNDTNFPVGNFISAGIAIFILLSFASKLTNDQLPIPVVVVPLMGWSLFFIYVLARRSFVGTNIHGPNPNEVPQ